MEKMIRHVLKARQSDQETFQKLALDVALREVTAAIRDMHDKANLDIEREKVKATKFARDSAEREERKRKEIYNQAIIIIILITILFFTSISPFIGA